MKRDAFSYLILLIFLLLCGLRIVHITADPPTNLSWSGGLFFDEGALAHNARNKVLFGEWKMDQWNDFYYSPVLTYIKWAVFSLFGVGLPQLRIVPIVFSWLTLVGLYLSLRATLTRFVATIAVLLLGGHYIFLMYNRIGLTETPLLFFAILTLYFWQLGLRERNFRRSSWYMFFAGISCFMVYIFKALLIYFLPVPLASMMILWLTSDEKTEQKRFLILTACFLAGMAIAVASWLVLFYYPNYDSIHQAGDYVKQLSIPRSFRDLFKNVSYSPFFLIFSRTPVTLLMAWCYLLYPAYLIFHKRSKLQPVDLFAGLWFIAHFIFFVGFSYRPTRYYIPVIPAMSILAARGITLIAGIKTFRLPYKFSGVFWIWCWLIGGILGVYGLIPLIYSSSAFFSLTLPRLSSFQSMILGAILSLFITLIFAKWIKTKRGLSFHISLRLPQIIFVALFMTFSVINGFQYYRWATRPQYVVRDVSRELGAMLNNAFFAGLATPMLCIENTHQALYVWENFFNYQAPFKNHKITHLFLAEFNKEVQYYQRKFPEIFKRTKLLKTYSIKGSKYYLYSIKEPEISVDIQEMPDINDPVTVVLGIENHDPYETRKVEVNWVSKEEGTRDESPLSMEKIALLPREKRTISRLPIAFDTPYTLRISLSESAQDVYEAEHLSSIIGEKRSDSQASGGYAVYGKQTSPPAKGFLAYGPYWIYPTGKFTTDFRLKYSRKKSHPSVVSEEPLAIIDVTTNFGKTILAKKVIKARDFQQMDSYQMFQLSYELSSPQTLEFRVFTNGQSELWIDTVTHSFVKTDHQSFSVKSQRYEAEKMSKTLGTEVPDVSASQGAARHAKLQEGKGLLTYGIRALFSRGEVQTDFRLKYDRKDSYNQKSEVDPIAFLEITTDKSKTILAKRPVYATDFAHKNMYQTFRVPYRLPSPQKLEFRVWTYGRADIWIDRITTSTIALNEDGGD